MPDVYILTLGCPKNTVSSRRLVKALNSLGVTVVDSPEAAAAVIVNTCGFIEAAKEESIDILLELAGRRPAASTQKIIAIGCLSERYGAELTKAIPEVDRFLGFDQLDELPEILRLKGELSPDFQAHRGEPTAYLEISDGCDNKCSFCAIPAIRGSYVSRQLAKIVAEAAYLADGGCRELVVVGQDTGAYGCDLKPKTDLPALVRGLCEIEGIDWIRLMYVQPQHVSDDLISAIADNRKICPYLDLPFQHASKKILRAMKRRGDAESFLKAIDRLREKVPDIAIRTSIIVGFPGETEDDFEVLADFLRRAQLDYVGVFEFSAEDGTPAAALSDHVSEQVKKTRSEQLRLLADEISAGRRRRFIGRALDALIESKDDHVFVGRSRFQAPDVDGEIIIEGDDLCPGEMVKVKIEAEHDYDLIGRAEHDESRQ